MLREALQALALGLQLALAAPPIAAASFATIQFAASSGSLRDADVGEAGLLGIAIALVSGAYLLGAIPAFVAGLSLRPIRRVARPLAAAGLSGAVGVVTYLLTFGSHLPAISTPGALVSHYLLPAFLGVALPSYWLSGRAVET